MAEYGSFFDARPPPARLVATPEFDAEVFCGTGRQAIFVAMEALRSEGVTRLLVPTYFCPDVTRWLSDRLDIARYPCAPFDVDVELDVRPDEAALVVEYFGMKSGVRTSGTVLIDRTHMPWATYDYQVAPTVTVGSLRKAFPVADGGFLRTSNAMSIPPHVSARTAHDRAAREMRDAMVMKHRWLVGGGSPEEKASFLARLRHAEHILADGEVAAVSEETRTLLRTVSVTALDTTRRRNVRRLCSLLAGSLAGIRVIETPSFAVLICESGQLRERLRASLISNDVFPNVLWALEGDAPATHLDLSRRVISLHADFRYTLDEMDQLAAAVKRSRMAA